MLYSLCDGFLSTRRREDGRERERDGEEASNERARASYKNEENEGENPLPEKIETLNKKICLLVNSLTQRDTLAALLIRS